jgi:hypothetical protein
MVSRAEPRQLPTVKEQVNKVEYLDGLTLHHVIRGSPLHVHICSELHRMLGTVKNGTSPPFFPGPQPISIERKHFKTLKNNKYMVCEKTDGVRHGVMMTTYGSSKVLCIINRALEAYVVQIRLDSSYYAGTLLDSEVVRHNDGRWCIAIYDAMFFKNKNIGPLDLTARLLIASTVCGKITKMKKDPFSVYVKSMFPLCDIRQLFEKDHVCHTDGLIFTPIDDPIRVGTHNTMFKWKPLEMNTIDFLAQRRRGGWGLYVQERGNLVFESMLKTQTVHRDWHPILNQEGVIVECKLVDNVWYPNNTRTDKTHPNNRHTYYRTLVNIQEDIKADEFIFT